MNNLTRFIFMNRDAVRLNVCHLQNVSVSQKMLMTIHMFGKFLHFRESANQIIRQVTMQNVELFLIFTLR